VTVTLEGLEQHFPDQANVVLDKFPLMLTLAELVDVVNGLR
jgi:hypothetical protein